MGKFFSGLTLMTVMLAAAGAQATTVMRLSLDQMVQHSRYVYLGEVVNVSNEVKEENGGLTPYTKVTVEVLDSYKGALSGKRNLWFYGGELDGYTHVIADMPSFAPGEQAVFFDSDKPSVSPLVGMFQGLYRVMEVNGQKRVFDHLRRPVTGMSEGFVKVARLPFKSNTAGQNQMENTVRPIMGKVTVLKTSNAAPEAWTLKELRIKIIDSVKRLIKNTDNGGN